MLLNFHCWFNFPLSLVPQIVSKYDDGGSKSRASANVTAVMSAKQDQRSALIDELKSTLLVRPYDYLEHFNKIRRITGCLLTQAPTYTCFGKR